MNVEQLEGLLKKVKEIQSIMIEVSTGGSLIQEREDEYIVIYLDIVHEIESLAKVGLSLPHHNSFRTLWDWYGYWSSRLPSYASRRQYVQELYDPLMKPIADALRKHQEDRAPPEDLIRDLTTRVETQPELPAHGYRMRFEWLHPRIVHRCHIPYETGEFEEAIFSAMTVVEEEIRKKIAADPVDTGVVLISKAMDPNAPILSFSRVKAEQEIAYSLFRGAIGSFKSAFGHRFLDTTDPVNTFECLALGSLLMRMLDRAR